MSALLAFYVILCLECYLTCLKQHIMTKRHTHFSLIDNWSVALTSELFEFSILARLTFEMLFMLSFYANIICYNII